MNVDTRTITYTPRAHVYVAGPYTNPDPVENTHRVILVGERLYAEGFFPVLPHVSLLNQLVCPHEAAHWYERDLHALSRCDALLRIPGYSAGADLEVEFAHAHGIPVYYTLEQLLQSPPEV